MKNGKIGSALAAATYSLLGTLPAPPAVAEESGRWDLDTALMYYSEGDDRVQDVSLGILAKRSFDDDRVLNLDLTVDTLTGASPSGATALGAAQTFTRPSGKGTYTTPAGAIPLDDSFLDTRVALGVGWTQPLARLYTLSAGLGFSTEYDYTHLGANLSLARDFNQRNTTVSAGLAYSMDDIDPVGGAPLPLSAMADVGDLSNRRGTDSKDVLDLLLGVTQVINRTTIVRLNYSYSDASGYLTDPYKILSLVDPLTGDTLGRSPAPGTEGPSGVYLFESRPDTRAKHALFGEVKKFLGGKVLDVSYRFMTDDWGIDSHTVEGKLRWPIGDSMFIEPQLRYYTQTAADFYQVSLLSGEPLPLYASADSRLSDMDAITVGVKFGWTTPSSNEWSARLAYYSQTGNVDGSQLIGSQNDFKQYPDMDAVIVQFGYRFRL